MRYNWVKLLNNLQEILIQCQRNGLHGVLYFVFGQFALPNDYYLPAVLLFGFAERVDGKDHESHQA